MDKYNSYTSEGTNPIPFLPKQMDNSTGDVDLYNLLHTEKINAQIEKVLYIEGKLLHQISDFL